MRACVCNEWVYLLRPQEISCLILRDMEASIRFPTFTHVAKDATRYIGIRRGPPGTLASRQGLCAFKAQDTAMARVLQSQPSGSSSSVVSLAALLARATVFAAMFTCAATAPAFASSPPPLTATARGTSGHVPQRRSTGTQNVSGTCTTASARSSSQLRHPSTADIIEYKVLQVRIHWRA